MRQVVDEFIDRHNLLATGATIVVGVSGGPDSMALLHYLSEYKSKWRLTLVACCVDHMLRGKDSQEDVFYVREFCLRNNIHFYTESIDVGKFKEKNKLGTQEAARVCRYEVFERAMKKFDARFLALAHHGDDQIETMLMQETRGLLGVFGRGIPVRRPFADGEIIRPFLAITKEQIEKYCKEVHIDPRRDVSNSSDKYTRNRFRHHVLPFLKDENPQVHISFQQESEYLREDHAFLMSLAKKVYKEAVIEEKREEIRLSIEKLLAIPISLQRRVIHLILSYLYTTSLQSDQHQAIHINSILQWLKNGHTTGQFHLPRHLMIYRAYEVCTFTFKKDETVAKGPYDHLLNIPGVTETPMGIVKAELTEEVDYYIKGLNTCVLDYDTLSLPLWLRSRKPGDRLHPKGMHGTQKLKSVFINEKVAPEYRSTWPILIDDQGDILWVPGIRHSAKAVYGGSTKKYLILSFTVIEEHGGKQYEK